MELSVARRIMIVTRLAYFKQKHEVAIARLINPNFCLHAGSFIRFRYACEVFLAEKLKQLYKEKKSRRTSDDPALLRSELANSTTFYRILVMKRRSAEPVQPQPQPQPVQQQRRRTERIIRTRAAARGRRDVFMKKVAEHQRRFLLRHQQTE
jgi:hypothetical protein